MTLVGRLSRFLGRTPTEPEADPPIMRGIGDRVRRKLRADPRIEPRGGKKADLFLLRGFLDEAECRRLIAIIDSRIQPSVLFTDKASPRGRTSSTHFFAKEMPETRALAERIAAVTGIGLRHFLLDRPHWQTERHRGGQRSWTAMVYLNTPEAGGATAFPALDLTIAPEPGMLVVWDNMDRKGRPNRATLHAALPVEAGVKYVVTQWYRQGEWSLRGRD